MARKRDEEGEEHSKQVKGKGFRVEESEGALAEDPECQQAVPKKNSKRRKKGQELNPEGTEGEQNLNSKSSKKEQDVNPPLSIQGQELADAKQINEVSPKIFMDVKDEKKKKKKKKRDRWGQVLDDEDITHAASNDGMEGGMLDGVDNARDASYESMDGAVTEHDSQSSEYDNKTVCAGGMPYDTTEEDILECFKECGTVARVLCMKFADTQRFKGLAFITFETEAAASKALSLDGVNMGGRHIKVEKFRAGGKVLRAPPRREAGSLSVYVGNLDWGVQKIDIKRFFKGCDIDNVRLAVDKSTGDFRGYGHVDFSDEKSLEKAIKMDQKSLLGRPVKVCYAVPKG
eukprot:c19798_g1_i1 orf=115-1149(+)